MDPDFTEDELDDIITEVMTTQFFNVFLFNNPTTKNKEIKGQVVTVFWVGL